MKRGSIRKGWFEVIVLTIAIMTGGKGQASSSSPPNPHPMLFDWTTRIDANQIAMFVTNSGTFARDLSSPGGPAGFYYPRGTSATALYAAGLWIGAMIDGAPHVTVAEYSTEYQPGKIHSDGTWDDPSDPALHVYKIVRGDTLSSDYLNWPGADGAPLDSEGKPAFLGTQTLWSIYNDADQASHTNNAGSTSPLGIEVQHTTWGFSRPGSPLDEMEFLRYKIINKAANTLSNVYLSLWSDPDLGGSSDDQVGCDTTLALGYCYNATNLDDIYGTRPPAVGTWLLEGPIVPSPGDTGTVEGRRVPNYRNLRISSFSAYINGTDFQSPFESYNCMQGLDRLGDPVIDPTTWRATRYMYPGDPVAGTGWLDPSPSDRRMMLNVGPFTMAPGDSQIVTFAIGAARAQDRLSSITSLKLYAGAVDAPVPVLLTDFHAERSSGAVVLQWEVSRDITGASFDVFREVDGVRTKLNADPIAGGPSLSFVDSDAPTEEVLYWLCAIAAGGFQEWLGPVRVPELRQRVRLTLSLCGSNPFRSAGVVEYLLPLSAWVRLEIHDATGLLVRTLVDAAKRQGSYQATWDGLDDSGRQIPAGVYFVRLQSGGDERSVKLIRIR